MGIVFSGKRGRQCSQWSGDAAGRLDQAPPIPPPAHLHWQAAGGVRYSAVSTSSRVARNSLASSDENTSGGRKPFCSPRHLPLDDSAGGRRFDDRLYVTVLENRPAAFPCSQHRDVDHGAGHVVGPNHLVLLVIRRNVHPRLRVARNHPAVAVMRVRAPPASRRRAGVPQTATTRRSSRTCRDSGARRASSVAFHR